MDLELFERIEIVLNKPLIDLKLIENKHLIFIKYTSELYYKYSIELIETLCKKSKSENKKLLFYETLNFLLKILYNCGNKPCLNNFDLTILCTFSLGIKSIENRFKIPSIKSLKKIYPEKFESYSNDELKIGEIKCLKLLNYNINILTPYECLFYLLNKSNNLNLFDHCVQHLDNLIINGDKKFIFKSPIDIAKRTIEYIKIKEKEKNNFNIIDILKNKEGRFSIYKENTILKRKKVIFNNESISTNCSSPINLSKFINNSNNSQNKNKAEICSNLINTFSNYRKNKIEQNLESNLICVDPDNNDDNIVLNTKNSLVLENMNKVNNNIIYKYCDKTTNIKKRKDNKNFSAQNIFKKEIKLYKNNLKTNLEVQIPATKEKPFISDKNNNSNNNSKNNGIIFRNINNNINFNCVKLTELCKKMNFDAFASKIK